MNSNILRNLARIAVFGHSLTTEASKRFKMARFEHDSARGLRGFCNDSVVGVDIRHECGTTCCLAGFGPAAGIPAEPAESWHHYCTRVYSCTQDKHGCLQGVFPWLFHPSWDDDLEFALKRVAWLVQGRQVPQLQDTVDLDGIPEESQPEDYFILPDDWDGFEPNWDFINEVAEGHIIAETIGI